jgi:hypothetical protein
LRRRPTVSAALWSIWLQKWSTGTQKWCVNNVTKLGPNVRVSSRKRAEQWLDYLCSTDIGFKTLFFLFCPNAAKMADFFFSQLSNFVWQSRPENLETGWQPVLVFAS